MLLRLSICAAVALAALVAAGATAGAGEPLHGKARVSAAVADYVPGEVVVRFTAGANRTERAAVLRATGAERKQWLRLPGAELLKLPAGTSVTSGVRQL